MSGSGSTTAAPTNERARASSAARLALALLLCALMLSGATVGAGAAWVHRYGTFLLEVEGRGAGAESVRVRLPGAALIALVKLFPLGAFSDVPVETRWLLPAAGRFLAELERIPDAVLLQVEGEDETVVIEKRGRSLLVRVDNEEERVRIEIPLSVLTELGGRVAKKGASFPAR